jgi:hypothetical protein
MAFCQRARHGSIFTEVVLMATKNPILMWNFDQRKMELTLVYNPDFPARPYTVKVEYSTMAQRKEIEAWCGETFGVHTDAWNNPRWRVDDRRGWWYHFKNEADAALFVMRWS